MKQFFSYLADMDHMNVQLINDASQIYAVCIVKDLAALVDSKKIIGKFPVIKLNGDVIGAIEFYMHIDSSDLSVKTKMLSNPIKSVNCDKPKEYKPDVSFDMTRESLSQNDLISHVIEKGRKLREKLVRASIEEETMDEKIVTDEMNNEPIELLMDNFFNNGLKSDFREESNDLLNLIMSKEKDQFSSISTSPNLSVVSHHSEVSEQSLSDSLINNMFYNENIKFEHLSSSNNLNIPKKVYEEKLEKEIDHPSLPIHEYSYSNFDYQECCVEIMLQVMQARNFQYFDGSMKLCTRMLFSEDIHKSENLSFSDIRYPDFSLVLPLTLHYKIFPRLKNNFIIIEVWHNELEASKAKVIGLSKIPVHSLFMKLKEIENRGKKLILKDLVVVFDNWIGVNCYQTQQLIGELNVVIAIGPKDLVSDFRKNKEELMKNLAQKSILPDIVFNSGQTPVNYLFEINIDKVNDLSIPENFIWGEGDVFVKYRFLQQSSDLQNIISTNLKEFVSKSTLVTPALNINYKCLHKFLLSDQQPLHSYVLSGLSSSCGVIFSVYYRIYHPEVIDNLIGKATLSFPKLCALVLSENDIKQEIKLPLSNEGISSTQYPAAGESSSLWIRLSIKKHDKNELQIKERSIQTSPVEDGLNPIKIISIEQDLKHDLEGSEESTEKIIPTEVIIENASNLDFELFTSMKPFADFKLYLSYNGEKIIYSPVVTWSSSPIFSWHTTSNLRLSRFSQNLIVKIWSKYDSASSDKIYDEVLGFVCIDLSPLSFGLSNLSGWYNIMDFSGNCRGQMKISVHPLQPFSYQKPESLFVESNAAVFEQKQDNQPDIQESIKKHQGFDYFQKEDENSQSFKSINDAACSVAKDANISDSAEIDEVLWKINLPNKLPENSSQSILMKNLQENFEDLENMQKNLALKFNEKSIGNKVKVISTEKSIENVCKQLDQVQHEDLQITGSSSKYTNPTFISTNNCSNVSNTVNITVHHDATKQCLDQMKIATRNPFDFLHQNQDKESLAQSLCGTYDILDNELSKSDDDIIAAEIISDSNQQSHRFQQSDNLDHELADK